jgi:hypothetical protein
MRLAQRPVEADLIVAFNETDAQRRRYKVLCPSFLLFHDVFPFYNLRDMLGDRGVGAFSEQRQR